MGSRNIRCLRIRCLVYSRCKLCLDEERSTFGIDDGTSRAFLRCLLECELIEHCFELYFGEMGKRWMLHEVQVQRYELLEKMQSFRRYLCRYEAQLLVAQKLFV
jgi:hypothetical protein